MTDFPPIFLLRHGQTEWNLEHRLQGAMDSPLTALGRAQAQAQGRLLTPVLARNSCVAVVSPLGRTRKTAEIAFAGHTFTSPPRFDTRIAEINAGDWEGLKRTEIVRRWPHATHEQSGFEYSIGAVNGEGADALRRRCAAFLRELTGPTVLVTHGICSVMLRGLLCDLDFEGMCNLPLQQGCIFEIRDGREEILQEAK